MNRFQAKWSVLHMTLFLPSSKAEDGQTQFQVITEDAFKGKDESPAFVEEIGPSEQGKGTKPTRFLNSLDQNS